jgi:hypothetical protein
MDILFFDFVQPPAPPGSLDARKHVARACKKQSSVWAAFSQVVKFDDAPVPAAA